MADSLTEEELKEIQNAGVISCIKLVRERTGLGLMEAKHLVESHPRFQDLVNIRNRNLDIQARFRQLENSNDVLKQQVEHLTVENNDLRSIRVGLCVQLDELRTCYKTLSEAIGRQLIKKRKK